MQESFWGASQRNTGHQVAALLLTQVLLSCSTFPVAEERQSRGAQAAFGAWRHLDVGHAPDSEATTAVMTLVLDCNGCAPDYRFSFADESSRLYSVRPQAIWPDPGTNDEAARLAHSSWESMFVANVCELASGVDTLAHGLAGVVLSCSVRSAPLEITQALADSLLREMVNPRRRFDASESFSSCAVGQWNLLAEATQVREHLVVSTPCLDLPSATRLAIVSRVVDQMLLSLPRNPAGLLLTP